MAATPGGAWAGSTPSHTTRRKKNAPGTTARKKPPKGEQFRTGRHLEKRDTKRGLYTATRTPYPNQTEFGERGEWVDSNGRQYRLPTSTHPTGWMPGERIPLPQTALERAALVKHTDDGSLKLWVKLPRNGGPNSWFSSGDLVTHAALELRPVIDGVLPQQVLLKSADRRNGKGRTGMIVVSGYRD